MATRGDRGRCRRWVRCRAHRAGYLREPGLPTLTDREIETTLVVVGEEPDVVADAVGRLVELDSYQLVPRPAQRITDLYFGDPAGELRRHRLALRVRSSNGTATIALKGPAAPDVAVEDRIEIERAASPEAVAEFGRILGRKGIVLSEGPSPAGKPGSPSDALRALGLEVVQERETERRPRDVLADDPDRKVIAELAVDAVRYRLGGGAVRHHEIEIEAKTSDGAQALPMLTETIRTRFPELRPWRHGKLATGLAIEELLQDGLLAIPGRGDAMLDAADYERLEQRLVRASD